MLFGFAVGFVSLFSGFAAGACFRGLSVGISVPLILLERTEKSVVSPKSREKFGRQQLRAADGLGGDGASRHLHTTFVERTLNAKPLACQRFAGTVAIPWRDPG
jgi:hypothetical protein